MSWVRDASWGITLEAGLARYAHDLWARWMIYLFSRCEKQEDGSLVIPSEFVKRWNRQIGTAFKDLPESEQLSDYNIALEIMGVIDENNNR